MRKRDLMVGIALGAGMVYFFDPREGMRRRTRFADQPRDMLSELSDEGRSRGLGRWREERERWPGVASGRYGARVGDIGGLEAANLERAGTGGGLLGAVGALGALLALYGLSRHGMVGVGARAMGAGLVMSKLREGHSAGATRERRRIVDIQKSLRIEAPVVRVYAFWSDYANLPLFLSNVRRVDDLGAGRSRWALAGPDGVPLEWEAMITVETPGELVAWRSRPGSPLEYAGAVRFSREGTGTRLDLRLCYNPPAGDATMADLLGAYPRAKLNEDLGAEGPAGVRARRSAAKNLGRESATDRRGATAVRAGLKEHDGDTREEGEDGVNVGRGERWILPWAARSAAYGLRRGRRRGAAPAGGRLIGAPSPAAVP
jgi:uncharacterized membrane protein